MKFTERVPPKLLELITKFYVAHPEHYLLAVVYGHLGEQNLLRVRTDAEKSLLLAALNSVECVAYVGAQMRSKRHVRPVKIGGLDAHDAPAVPASSRCHAAARQLS